MKSLMRRAGRRRVGRPKSPRRPLRVPDVSAYIGADRYSRDVARRFKKQTPRLSLKKLRAMPGPQLLALETFVIEALQIVADRIPAVAGPDMPTSEMLTALRDLDGLRRHIKNVMHARKMQPVVGRLGYQWAQSIVPLGRRAKAPNKYALQIEIARESENGLSAPAIARKLWERAQAIKPDEDLSRWEKIVYRELRRISRNSPVPVNVALARRAAAHRREHPKLSADEALLAVFKK